MSEIITPPLAAHFVWHPNDSEAINPIIQKFRRYLTRDIDRPFSRELNIPTFLYSSRQPSEPPANAPKNLAKSNVVFLFLSTQTLINEKWKEYVDSFANKKGIYIVPVAIDHTSLNHVSSGRLKNLNFIRAFDWPTLLHEDHGILTLSHELYRFGLNNINTDDVGKNSSIKLFLSHAKKGDTGLRHAEAIKRFLDNSNMQRFFDANEISPAFRFDEEIEKHIRQSTVVAITSDTYSSRYWCQREILCAKKERRPIVVVNSLENYEDRVFPAAANVPCVHVSAEPLQEKDILRILIAALLETIRFNHAHQLLNYYKTQGWIDKTAETFARPPEIQQLVDLLETKQKSELEQLHVCYPEPPLYKEETDWTEHFGIKISTPLWSTEEDSFPALRVGLSVSDYETDGYEQQHLDLDELKRFSQSVSRHLLARQNTLIYGGDLRDDGFTQFILEEATVLRDRLQVEKLYVENHLAWPLYTESKNTEWAGKYFGLLELKKHTIPADVIDKVKDTDSFLPHNCAENKYIWSRCLTEMRQKSIESSDARIFAGGKLQGYLGKMPGVLEEFLLANEQEKPIYLVGGLGGLVGTLCQSILEKKIAEPFSEQWQIQHNSGYVELQKIAKQLKFQANYSAIQQQIEMLDTEILAKRAGLSSGDYIRLMKTSFIDECVHLILKGLKNIKGNKDDEA
ncbi:TIR domain-containing protein [Rodentibacter haemolyticus]|uniref:TIR domain-containing protein n=2 Tax=Bacteria TaxID=2 RepID=A0ABX6UV49_9PAST|nr:TIR domain-containing protein [Rodentibacter haemolyticus]QPB41912.1 TIR domain-containing protein [Rodentibacter haemolyticus]